MKKFPQNYLVICGCAMMTLFSCNNSDEPKLQKEAPAQYSIKLSAPQQKVLSQGNDFAFDVLKAINKEDGNVFVSPYSLGQDLAMLANGAEGETFNELAKVLKIGDGATLEDINTYYETMNGTLTTINCSSKFLVGNSVWLNKNYNILDNYKNDMGKFYNATVETLDFNDSKSVDRINSWAKESTKGFIPNIVKELDAMSDAALLLNSVYFKGLWTYFPVKNTHDDIFRNQFDRNEKVKMMSSRTILNGCITDDELALELTYNGEAFQMVIIMPKREKINNYVKTLNGEKYAQILSQMTKNDSEVIMPKFKSAYENDFSDALKAMGVSRVMSSGIAQLKKISPDEGIYLSKISQKTTIEVNEDGTIATAVTTGKVEGFTDNSPILTQYVIDHPFIYLIKERTTGAILFIGKVQSMAGMQ